MTANEENARPLPRARRVARDALVFWAVAALFAVLLAVLQVAAQALLLTFAGVLFGTSLRGLAQAVSTKAGWPVRWCLIACLALLLALSVGAVVWIVPNVADQATILADRLVRAYEQIRRSTAASPLLGGFIDDSGNVGQQLGSIATRAAGILASTVGVLGAVVFVVFVALYVAASPDPYRRGLVRLVPRDRRDRAGVLLGVLGATLRRWLFGRLVSMTLVGLVTATGLWLLGIPLPVTLGLIAALLGFVPNIGPIVSAIPAALMAFTVSPLHVAYVLGLYLAVNLADGYGLTPLIQKRAVAIPPALIIAGQVVAGTLWGVLGVMFATPLLACLLVLVRELYVRPLEERGS